MRFLIQKYFKFFLFLMAIVVSCRHPYNPPAFTSNLHLLVVNGFINAGQNAVSTINLSRTQNIGDTSTFIPELSAQVFIEGQSGGSYNLHGQSSGDYLSDSLNLNVSDMYRLRIVTLDGKSYVSDFVAVKLTPPIDSLNWQQSEDVNNKENVTVYVNTHDPQNNTRYYRWDFTETWEYKSTLSGIWGVANGMTYYKATTAQQTDSCWRTANSSNIVIGTSVALNN